MPGGNRTGPMGSGPGTGRGLGYCTGMDFRRGLGRGLGFGAGRGRQQGRFGYPSSQPLEKEQEMAILTDQVNMLENELALIKQRQAEIKNQKQSNTSKKE